MNDSKKFRSEVERYNNEGEKSNGLYSKGQKGWTERGNVEKAQSKSEEVGDVGRPTLTDREDTRGCFET